MTIRENLLLGGINRRALPDRQKSTDYVLDLFPRLSERIDQMAGTLSGGEQQMLAIGRGWSRNRSFSFSTSHRSVCRH